MSNSKKRFPLFHVPHDGTSFPEELMESVCIPKEQFLSYHERMRDTGVLEMVPTAWRNSGNTLYFPVSRLLCDVERFLGPEEPMERLGMGFCYERPYDGTRIKTVSAELRRETLVWYHGHHEKLNRACIEHPRLLLLDMHSFSDDIVPRDRLRSGERTPDVCLGIDEKYTPPRDRFHRGVLPSGRGVLYGTELSLFRQHGSRCRPGQRSRLRLRIDHA